MPLGTTLLVMHFELQKSAVAKQKDAGAYDSADKALTKLANTAKCSYYSDKIVESSNTKQLFSITDKQMTRNNLTPLPMKHHLDELPELFPKLFLQ